MNKKTITQFVTDRNFDKKLFTAGPASLVDENLSGLMPCFGRGDTSYMDIEKQVLSDLKKMTGHSKIARLQGSASLALEIMTLNFLYGKVLVVNTGYYSERMIRLSKDAMAYKNITKVNSVDWKEISNLTDRYDWIIACPTETSCGLKIPINELFKLTKNCNAKLMLDATASIGLESEHELADVIAYSSCKGLFGLTGAAFIAFNELPNFNPASFYLDLTSHLDRKMTGPYHAITSLAGVLSEHKSFREAVVINKNKFLEKMKKYITLPIKNQPLLCTKVSCEIFSKDPKAILYKPRTEDPGSVVCHLGEVHLKERAEGKILDVLEWYS
tara:strand:+ start:4629 stop:5615 length:987 start_codon:yes stop_codon:yes gene_type:complete